MRHEFDGAKYFVFSTCGFLIFFKMLQTDAPERHETEQKKQKQKPNVKRVTPDVMDEHV